MDFFYGSYPNFKPLPDFQTGFFLPQNYYHQYVPVIPGMYFQQYPMQNGYVHPHLYEQQQQYPQIDSSRQNPQQHEVSYQVSQMPQIPPVNTLPTLLQPQGHQDGFYVTSMPSYANRMYAQFSKEQASRDRKAEKPYCHPDNLELHETFDPNCTSSNNNNLETSPNNEDCPQNQSTYPLVRQDNFQKQIKNEEMSSTNETTCKISAIQQQEYDNYGSKPHKRIKMEYDQENQHITIKQNRTINKIEKNQQNDQTIDQKQVAIKLEDTFRNLCKQEMEGEHLYQKENCEINSNKLQRKGVIFPLNLNKQGEMHSNQKKQVQSLGELNPPSSNNQNNLMLHLNKRPRKKQESNSRFEEPPTNNNKQQRNPKDKLTQDQDQQEPSEEIQELQLFYQNLSEEDTQLMQQLTKIKVQNCFKNLIKGLQSTVNKKFTKIYVYDNPNNQALNGNNLKTFEVISIESPTLIEKQIFSQKFNKYFKEKKINNTSIEQIVKNNLYSRILRDFLENYADRWISNSVLTNKEDNKVFLKFLQLSIKDHRYLSFLQKTQVSQLKSNQ